MEDNFKIIYHNFSFIYLVSQMPHISHLMSRILAMYMEYDDSALALPENLVNLLLIHASLLNISYIYYQNTSSWLYTLVLFARPSVSI